MCLPEYAYFKICLRASCRRKFATAAPFVSRYALDRVRVRRAVGFIAPAARAAPPLYMNVNVNFGNQEGIRNVDNASDAESELVNIWMAMYDAHH